VKRIQTVLLGFVAALMTLVSIGFFATMGLAVALFAATVGGLLVLAAQVQTRFGRKDAVQVD